MKLDNLKNVYCIGIGGIGLSAVVRMLRAHDVSVSGSDSAESDITKELEHLGAEIFYGQKENHISEDTDLVLYSKAIPDDNPDLVFAKEKEIQLMTYPEILGVLSKNKKTIQITGTHGKTTTTAMTARVLIDGELDPTVIVGSLMNHGGGKTNYIEGKSEYFVLESCEYKRSFEHINPFVLVITNLEEDHLDYYKDLADIQNAFRDVAKKVPQEGAIICNPHDPKVKPVIKDLAVKIIDYTKVDIDDFDLKVPGEYNRNNARCAAAVGAFLNLSETHIQEGLESFEGTWRRFEYRGVMEKGALLYDDYAHHPTEVMSAIGAFREKFPQKKLVIVFHPHLYSRTKTHKEEFISALAQADEVVCAPIFPAREPFDPDIKSEMLTEGILEKGVEARVFNHFDEIIDYVKEIDNPDIIVVTMGAGDIYRIADKLL